MSVNWLKLASGSDTFAYNIAYEMTTNQLYFTVEWKKKKF